MKRFCDFKKIVGPNDNLDSCSYGIFCPSFTSNNMEGTFWLGMFIYRNEYVSKFIIDVKKTRIFYLMNLCVLVDNCCLLFSIRKLGVVLQIIL